MVERIVTASVVLIGNEILSGRTQDTNLAHLAKQLNEWGVQVREARVVPDVLDVVVAAVNAARAAFDYVFTTGGIGPTHDDITAECIAAAFGVPLVLNEDIAAVIRRRPAPPDVLNARLRMARIPQGATLIDNPTGGPHGFRMGNVFVMAGIPMVMQAMLTTLESELEGGAVVRSRSVTAYVSEGEIATALGALQARHPQVDLGSYPFHRGERYGTMLVMRGAEGEALERMAAEVRQLVEAAGGEAE